MKYRKTPSNQRETYTYTFMNGERVTIRPDQDGVTEADIKCLHRADDREVKNNIRNEKTPLTEQERLTRKQRLESHTEDTQPTKWHLSFDSLVSSDDGISTADQFIGNEDTSTTLPYDEDETDALQLLHDLIQSATERQQQVYRLVVLEGFNFVQTSRILGISNVAVRNHYRALIDKIRNDPALHKFFR